MKTVIAICFISLFLSCNFCFAHDHHFNSVGICTDDECGAFQIPVPDGGYYQINNLGELYWFANKSKEVANINAKLTSDIIVNNNVLNSDGVFIPGDYRVWECIGSSSKPYTGTFDGQGHTIYGLYKNNEIIECIGLFGCVKGAVIKNVTIKDSYFYGKGYVGGIAGKIVDNNSGNQMTQIINCHNYSTIGGKDYYFGGICGYQKDESSPMNVNILCCIERCTNFGLVKGYDYVGGIVGASQHVKIIACGNYNNVETTNSSKTYNGAICGSTSGSDSGYTLIQRCFCSEVSARGIVGYAHDRLAISNTCFPNTMELVASKISTSIVIAQSLNKQYSSDELQSGSVAYQMNIKAATDADDALYWYQTINSDDYPVLSSAHGTVYKVQTKCCYKNTSVTEGYSNTDAPTVLDDCEHTTAKRPSCTEVGNIEYYKCKTCSKMYSSLPSSDDNMIDMAFTIIPKIQRGDVNGDGKIDKEDVDACMKFVRCDDDTADLYEDAADYDNNGKVTVTDVAKIIDVANRNKGQ